MPTNRHPLVHVHAPLLAAAQWHLQPLRALQKKTLAEELRDRPAGYVAARVNWQAVDVRLLFERSGARCCRDCEPHFA
eukprot:4696950-Amphidinium_carterae.1